MRRILWTSALAAVLSLGAAACGDDATDGDADTTNTDTTTGGSDTATTGGTDTTAADTTTADPCDPNPCTNPPAAGCNSDNTASVTYSGPGTCTDNAGTAECDYGSGTETACDAGQICSGTTGACAAAGDPCDYTYAETASYVTKIAIGNQASDGSDSCCFDFTDDGDEDNALGEVLKLAQAFVGNLNDIIAEQISSGSLTLLLEYVGLDDLTNDSDVVINGFLGEDADTDGANNPTGMSAFTVSNSSFKEGTKEALINFTGATVTGGQLAAGPSLFTLTLPILEGVELSIAISDTQLLGEISQGANGTGVALAGDDGDIGAKLGGFITLVDLYTAINAFIDSSCVEVTDQDGDLVSYNAGQGAWTCAESSTVDSSGCEDSEDPAKQLAGFCGALIAFIQPDVNVDDADTTNDAISIGLWVEAESATLTADPACAQ